MVKLISGDKTSEIVFDNENYVLNEKDYGKSDISLSTYQGNNQLGVRVEGRTIGKRDVSIVGFILADGSEEMIEKKRNLQNVVGLYSDFYIADSGYYLTVSATASIEYAVEKKTNNKFLCKFLIEGTAANPCFTKESSETIQLAYWNAGFHFPYHVAPTKKTIMGLRESSQIKMIENEGETKAGMIITIQARVDGVKNVTLSKLLSNDKVVINYSLNKSDVIVINTNYGEKSIKLNGENCFSILAPESVFIQLDTGENYIAYDAEENVDAIDIRIDYLPQYMEVQSD